MTEELVAAVSNEFLDYQYQVLGIREFMQSPDVTEICINRPGEIYLENRFGWERVEVPSLTSARALQFCRRARCGRGNSFIQNVLGFFLCDALYF